MKRNKVLPWVAAAVWMAVIFLFSAQTGGNSGNTSGQIVRWFIDMFYKGFADIPAAKQAQVLEIIHLLVRKGAHFTEYAVLAMLVANALRTCSLSHSQWWFIPIALCALYAVTDEIHQYFVPGRACRFLDMCIDTAGAACGTAVFMLLMLIKKRASYKH